MTSHVNHWASSEKPVFVDQSGRRRRAYTLIGSGLALLLVTGLATLLVGTFGEDPPQVPGWPDAAPGNPTGAAAPTDSSRPGVIRRVPSPVPSPSPSSLPVPAPTPAVPSTPGPGKPADPPGKGAPGKPSKSPRR